jgi:uncharacterized membrane protein YdjX (TVP38/TMEM64 family)
VTTIPAAAASARRIQLWVLLVLMMAASATLVVSVNARHEVIRAMQILASGETATLRDYITSYGAWAAVVSALLMILQALAAPVPAFLLTFANGLAFGFAWGVLLTLVSATLAAAVCFGLARVLGRGAVEALVGPHGLARADRFFEYYGAWAVLIARLIPIVSFDGVSYAAGLTRVGFWPFLGATLVGMAPATMAYTYLGHRAPGTLPWLLAAAAVITLLGLLLGWRRAARRSADSV